jgi:hypothetical protein
MAMKDDFTVAGTKIEGQYENDRNAQFSSLYKAMIRECFGVSDVIIAHHLVYVTEEKHEDGFTYQVIEEVPSADTLIFDHDIARKIWGEDRFRDVLCRLALEPIETRDTLLERLYNGRSV